MSKELYYIQDARTYVGNCVVWWRPNGNGYTTKLDDAGKFEFDEAHRMFPKDMSDTQLVWLCDIVDRYAHRTVDMQDFPCAKRIEK